MNANAQFQVGNTYHARFICDADSWISETIAKRTAKTVTTAKGKTFRVSVIGGVEIFMPLGTYSMAPIMRAA